MAEHVLNLYEAKTQLSRLVDRAAGGENIIIAKDGKPMARLVPFEGTAKRRVPGAWKGQVRIADDFDALLPGETLSVFDGGER